MRARCSLCGVLVGAEVVGATQSEEFAAAGFACLLHLLKQHAEHVQADINPLIGLVANYTASLAFDGSEQWDRARESARQAILDLLPRVYWDPITQRFGVREEDTLARTPSPSVNDRK